MSMETATQFLSEMQKDETAFTKLSSMDGDSVVKMAAEKGYACSLDDLKAAMAELNSDNLSEDELASVSGGAGELPTITTRPYPPTWDPQPGQNPLEPTVTTPNPNTANQKAQTGL